ncbi:uncharacterized protein MAM_05527 [Metarhizium album ARSEF 1941]|uniref:Uncharacterized protein n=1 Tax=Metarhizium album (strain ARSEF 1941) TaxID=1081103 RepID=A0A0B2WSI4_METAS|nr:uncharacterized protein MAM_05527 [Metarhizium album ARSEF 1941]KHN96584.1 hypothetical protein MAM_05527 [Metarhizium album ARSEF 1941]
MVKQNKQADYRMTKMISNNTEMNETNKQMGSTDPWLNEDLKTKAMPRPTKAVSLQWSVAWMFTFKW